MTLSLYATARLAARIISPSHETETEPETVYDRLLPRQSPATGAGEELPPR